MALTEYTWPDANYMVPQRVEWGLSDGALINRSVLSGSVQTASDPFARWMVTLQFNNRLPAEQHQRAAWFAQLSGQANRARLWNHARPQPLGTMRESPTLNSTAAQFATTLVISGINGQTLVAGDMLGVGSMLLTVTTGGTVSGGTVTVGVAPKLRVAATGGTAVEWDKPTAQFLLTTDRAMIGWASDRGEPFAVSFEETW